jgi:hypothetical protein
MLAYHDGEWGVPCHDDRALFELLTLEGAQAGSVLGTTSFDELRMSGGPFISNRVVALGRCETLIPCLSRPRH